MVVLTYKQFLKRFPLNYEPYRDLKTEVYRTDVYRTVTSVYRYIPNSDCTLHGAPLSPGVELPTMVPQSQVPRVLLLYKTQRISPEPGEEGGWWEQRGHLTGWPWGNVSIRSDSFLLFGVCVHMFPSDSHLMYKHRKERHQTR